MSTNIQLPPYLYTQFEQLAGALNRPVQEVVIEELELRLQSLDDRLWAIVKQRLSPPDRQRLQDLMDKNNEGTLSETEKRDFDVLADEVERQMLERSKALVLLKQRGHDIDSYLTAQSNDTHS